jgi:hypothetical protein
MSSMNSATVIAFDRSRRVNRAMAARRRLHDSRRDAKRTRGRVWLNGRELGGTRAAIAHLGESYD